MVEIPNAVELPQKDGKVVFGTWVGLLLALGMSTVSRVVNAAFVARHHGTDGGRCRREGRKRSSSRRTGTRMWR